LFYAVSPKAQRVDYPAKGVNFQSLKGRKFLPSKLFQTLEIQNKKKRPGEPERFLNFQSSEKYFPRLGNRVQAQPA
jgi:hypothetical protein